SKCKVVNAECRITRQNQLSQFGFPCLPSNSTLCTLNSPLKLVARKGSAPPTSGCRPDVILFHHRAAIGCRGWNRTSIRAFTGRCPTIRRPGRGIQNSKCGVQNGNNG